MNSLDRDILFVALTRPQIFAGVTYSYFVFNIVLATEGFLIFRSAWVLAAALIVHLSGMLLCLFEPRFFDLWVTRLSTCPRVKNFSFWRGNSYRP